MSQTILESSQAFPKKLGKLGMVMVIVISAIITVSNDVNAQYYPEENYNTQFNFSEIPELMDYHRHLDPAHIYYNTIMDTWEGFDTTTQTWVTLDPSKPFYNGITNTWWHYNANALNWEIYTSVSPKLDPERDKEYWQKVGESIGYGLIMIVFGAVLWIVGRSQAKKKQQCAN